MGAAARVVVHVPEPTASGLVASVVADAKPTTIGAACWERALLGLVARVASLSVRVEEARDRGDRKALVALLRELTATQDDMSRFVAGVRVAMEAVR